MMEEMPVPDYLTFAPRILFKQNVLPHYLVFFVTKNCTARCRHCLLGERAHSTDELTVDEISRMTRHMDPLLFLLITGGDPFLRTDIVDIIKTFYRSPGFRNLGMPSNGFLTDRIVSAAETILTDCPGIDFAIDISLDGVGEDHDRIRQVPGLFDRATDTYRRLQQLQKKFPNFNLNVAVTVSHFNHTKLDELYRFLTDELGTRSINHLLCRGDPRDPQALDVDMENYTRFSDQLDADVKQNTLTGYHGYPFADLVNAMKMVRQKIIRTIREKDRFVVPCYAGQLGVILYPNGDLAPCELRNEILGNLREQDYDFRAIIHSPAAQAVRRQIRNEQCRCTYECFLTNAVMFHPRMFSSVLLEAVKMKWARLRSGGNYRAT